MAPSQQPLIYAHRGASFDYPEMSIQAYQAAVEQGADGFETDLRLTRDGVIVCWHDSDMKRVADCDLVISKSTYAEISAAYPVLTLTELLDLAMAHHKNLALETKHPVPTYGAIEHELLKVLDSYTSQIAASGIQIAIMSFSWRAIRRVRKSRWNSVYLLEHQLFAYFNPGRSVGPGVRILPNFKRTKVGNENLFVWTANSPEQILLCKSKGVDVMMTDRPAFARSILESA